MSKVLFSRCFTIEPLGSWAGVACFVTMGYFLFINSALATNETQTPNPPDVPPIWNISPKSEVLFTPVEISIGSGKLTNCLLELSNQTGIPIVIKTIAAKRLEAKAVQGTMTPLYALQLLLEGAGLSVSEISNVLIVQDAPIGTNRYEDFGDGAFRIEEIVVTGVSGEPRNWLQLSHTVSLVDEGRYRNSLQTGVVGVLQSAPGFSKEDSSGFISNGVTTRGIPGGRGYNYVSLVEDGLPLIYRSGLTDTAIVADMMTESVEVHGGGAASSWMVESPAALVNFVSRKGTADPEAALQVEVGTDAKRRISGYYGGSLRDNWRFSFGGSFDSSKGAKPVNFMKDGGHSLKFTANRDGINSTLGLVIKGINRRDFFYTPIPLINPEDPKEVPGFESQQRSLYSRDYAEISTPTPEGDISFDLSDGVDTDLISALIDYEYELGRHWKIRNRFRVTSWNNTFRSIFNGTTSELQFASERLNTFDTEILRKEFPMVDHLGYIYTSRGDAIDYTELDSINGNGLTGEFIWYFNNSSQDFSINDFSTSYSGDNFHFEVGSLLLKREESKHLVTSNFLADVKNRPERLDIAVYDVDGGTLGYLTDQGFTAYLTNFDRGSSKVRSMSFYARGRYDISDKISIDFGARNERFKSEFEAELVEADVPVMRSETMVSSTPNLLYSGEYPTGGIASGSRVNSGFSGTLGGTMLISKYSSVYLRFSKNTKMPNAGVEISSAAKPVIDSNEYARFSEEEFHFSEVGFRWESETLKLNLVAYGLKADLVYASSPLNRLGGKEGTVVAETQSVGLEFGVRWEANPMITIEAGGEISSASVDFPGSRSMVRPIRVPAQHFYARSDFQVERLRGTVNVNYIGSIYDDISNQTRLPGFYTIDVSLDYQLTSSISMGLQVKNLTNTFALTESNPRDEDIFREGQRFGYGRPILDRHIGVSLLYRMQ